MLFALLSLSCFFIDSVKYMYEGEKEYLGTIYNLWIILLTDRLKLAAFGGFLASK